MLPKENAARWQRWHNVALQQRLIRTIASRPLPVHGDHNHVSSSRHGRNRGVESVGRTAVTAWRASRTEFIPFTHLMKRNEFRSTIRNRHKCQTTRVRRRTGNHVYIVRLRWIMHESPRTHWMSYGLLLDLLFSCTHFMFEGPDQVKAQRTDTSPAGAVDEVSRKPNVHIL